jgi:hypothetical protein
MKIDEHLHLIDLDTNIIKFRKIFDVSSKRLTNRKTKYYLLAIYLNRGLRMSAGSIWMYGKSNKDVI